PPAIDRGLVPRQSAERRCWPGFAEHEPDVRIPGTGGTGMKVVVKIGGSAIDDDALLSRCARTIADLVSDGHKVALVHGGGKALTRTLAQLGKKSEFIDGLRVTDAETRDVALMVLAGQVNKQLVAELAAAGQTAIGICGGDGASFRAHKKVASCDLGFVGEICAVDMRWIE